MSDEATLTSLQLSILRILWDRGEATSQEVCEVLNQERPLAPTTVATLLARLERKEVLTHRKRGRRHVYRATVSRREVRRSKVRELTASLFDGDPTALVSHLVRAGDVDADELARLREMVERAERDDAAG